MGETAVARPPLSMWITARIQLIGIANLLGVGDEEANGTPDDEVVECVTAADSARAEPTISSAMPSTMAAVGTIPKECDREFLNPPFGRRHDLLRLASGEFRGGDAIA